MKLFAAAPLLSQIAARDLYAQAASAIVMGDFVSAYLGILYGLDPTPVEAIAMLKDRLAKAAPTEGSQA